MASKHKKVKVKGKTKYEHRLIAKAAVNRIVHHKDGDKGNNSPGNLESMSRAEHNREHKAIHPTTKKCVVCGAKFTPPPTHRLRAKVCSKESCRSAILSRRAKAR